MATESGSTNHLLLPTQKASTSQRPSLHEKSPLLVQLPLEVLTTQKTLDQVLLYYERNGTRQTYRGSTNK